MYLSLYLGLLHRAQIGLADGFRMVADGHGDEPDVVHICRLLAAQCDDHAAALAPFAQRYGEEAPEEPDRLHPERGGRQARSGPVGLLRDLQDLYVAACECDIVWTLVGQAAQGARDDDLLAVVTGCEGETANQIAWLRTRMKTAAPQALVVA